MVASVGEMLMLLYPDPEHRSHAYTVVARMAEDVKQALCFDSSEVIKSTIDKAISLAVDTSGASQMNFSCGLTIQFLHSLRHAPSGHH